MARMLGGLGDNIGLRDDPVFIPGGCLL